MLLDCNDLWILVKIVFIYLQVCGEVVLIGIDLWIVCNSIVQLKIGYVCGKFYLFFVGIGQCGFYGKQVYVVDVFQEVVVQVLVVCGLSVVLGVFQIVVLGIFDGQLLLLISLVLDSFDVDSVEVIVVDVLGVLFLVENVVVGSDKVWCLEQCLVMISDLMVYKVCLLNGIWVSLFYLYNGLVVIFYDLLLLLDLWLWIFYIGSVEFDLVNVGYIIDVGGVNCFFFDSGKLGNVNGGYDYGNVQFNEQQCCVLVEYMKIF